MNDALDAGARAAIERAVSAVADPDDDGQIAAALRSISPALVDDVVFGAASSSAGAAADGRLLAVGVAASPGVGLGVVATTSLAALDRWESGRDVVLVVDETSPADEPAMRVASAIVTRGGGVSSHAAIIARQWGVPAVCGVGDVVVGEGQTLLVDGSTGEVRVLDAPPAAAGTGGAAAGVPPAHHRPVGELPGAVVTLLGWADRVASSRITVAANADLASDAQVAFDLGAAGIGLCRTEHQFLGDRASLVARVIDGDAAAVAELAALQRADLDALFEVAAGRPVTLRLLDAPRHEFGSGTPEHDPMLGVRGVRLGVLHPALVEAQVEAVAHAMCDVAERAGAGAGAGAGLPDVRLLVPMVSLAEEVAAIRPVVGDTLFRVGVERGRELHVPFGVMIETPRAALCASALAAQCDHFSFGTNDLTQLTYGMSRDDVDGTLLRRYRELGLIDRSPFETLDGSAVVRLLALACETGRARRPELALGMCGEHGGDPASIAVAVQLGIESVSVSPYRVPAARLAAAHAVLGPAPAGSG